MRPGEALIAEAPFTGGWAALQEVRERQIPELIEAFPGAVEAVESRSAVPQVTVTAGAAHDVLAWLKRRGYNMLVDVGGVDYLPRDPRFEVVYQLLALPRLWRLTVRARVAGESPRLPTATDLWPSAEPAEREVFDLFGIDFAGHPNLRRILMPDDWQGHPLRKDYPVQGPRDRSVTRPPADRVRFFGPRLAGGLKPRGGELPPASDKGWAARTDGQDGANGQAGRDGQADGDRRA